jgi:hypothetical protein
MTVNEVNTIQDLMNLDIELKFGENFMTLVKDYSSLVVIEFPEEGFNLTNLIKEKVRKNIYMIDSDNYIDTRDRLPILKEILNTI